MTSLTADDRERLKNVQRNWDEASADTSNKANWPPDGTYQGQVQRFDFFKAKEQLFLVTEIRVENDPKYAGEEVETVHNLEDPEKIAWAKKHLKTLGLDVETSELASIDRELNALLDTPIEFVIKTSEKQDAQGNNYRNLYVNERLGDPVRSDASDVPEEPEPEASENDKEIPF